jgi:hydroxymethylbilane synthase
MTHLIFATRPSALARWQTARVIQLLQAVHPGLECTEYILTTAGDRDLDNPLSETVSKSHFTREIEEVLLSGRADVAVHSLKDLPLEETPGIAVAAVPEREAAFDVLVSSHAWTLSSLPEGARIGTSSIRRSAQLLARRPDLRISPLRGTIERRLKKMLDGDYDAIVLAQAGLIRLGLQAHACEVLPLEIMLPAPGQGALAVQCRTDDERREILAAIHNPLAAEAVQAERAFLAKLGGRSLPIAAFAERNEDSLILTGAVISPDGKQSIRLSAVDQSPFRLGQRLSEFILERGAMELLKAGV